MLSEIPYLDPEKLLDVFAPFSEKPWSLLLHSSLQHPEKGRYSVIAIDPATRILAQGSNVLLNEKPINTSPFLLMNSLIDAYAPYAAVCPEKEWPYQGGVLGVIGYDALSLFEETLSQHTTSAFPWDLALGIYDLSCVVDHLTKRTVIFSMGYPETEPSLQKKRQKQRLKAFQEQLLSKKYKSSPIVLKNKNPLSIHASWSKEDYLKRINQLQEYIAAGDIFQANLAQHFQCTLPKSPYSLFKKLSHLNPAPFSSFAVYPDGVFLSCSPECFLKSDPSNNHIIQSYPIKGTIHSSPDPVVDKERQNWLKQSRKNRAENIMILDLMRNDLSRCSLPGSVKVLSSCALESYAGLHHLVSGLQGQLNPKTSLTQLLKSTFPAGSITGAPKMRAMEIIALLEQRARTLYCGIFLSYGFHKELNTSINIRSIQCDQRNSQKLAHIYAGGGIILRSDGEEEFEESLLKAEKLFQGCATSFTLTFPMT
jgi:para-aminobenzoate synthetase component I